ncbi:MAG: hypothetical protein M1812_004710 [Candelaria pacifica]|nr:MAG: hypothetical protein M1812_004710 [Candelaria pacifica]
MIVEDPPDEREVKLATLEFAVLDATLERLPPEEADVTDAGVPVEDIVKPVEDPFDDDDAEEVVLDDDGTVDPEFDCAAGEDDPLDEVDPEDVAIEETVPKDTLTWIDTIGNNGAQGGEAGDLNRIVAIGGSLKDDILNVIDSVGIDHSVR